MNANSVNIAVVDGKTITQTVDLGAAKTGLPVRIKAVQGGKYIIGEGEKGFAPENLTIKRVGKNLHIALEGTDPDQAQLIIENFEGSGGQLVGLAEDGSYYEFISSDADQDGSAAFLYDGAESAQVLGSQPLAGFGNGLVAGAGIGWFWPALLGLGALGLLGGVYAAVRNKDDDNNDQTPPVGGGNGDKGSLAGVTDNVGDKQGLILPGESTDDKTPTFVGVGKPGTSVEIVDNGKVIGTAPVGEDGRWEFTPAEPGLSDGSHNIVIIPVDADGNKGEGSPGHIVIVDTVAPAAPLIDGVYDDAAPDEGMLAAGDSTNDTTPTLKGTAEAGAIVHIYDNGEEIGSVKADQDGKWEFTPETALAEGDHEFTIAAEDAAGNISVPSLPFPIFIDTTAPEKPGPGTGGIDDIIDNVGPEQGSIGDGDSTDDKTPTFTGSGATPGDTVVIIDDGKPIGSVVVGDDGKWEFTPEPALGDGPHEIVVVIKDPAGNVSEPSDPITVIIVEDTTPPVKPTPGEGGIEIIIDDVGPDTGIIKDGDTTDDTAPTFVGSGAVPGDIVIISDNGEPIGSVVVGEDGKWAFTPAVGDELVPGSHEIVVVIKDPAGNVSEPSDPITIIVEKDTTPPAKPTPGEGGIEIISDNVGPVTGIIKDGDTTDDTTPTFGGSGAVPGDTVIIIDHGEPIGSVVVGEDGKWEFTPEPALDDGPHELVVVIVDPEGNESEPSDPITIIVDTEAPILPSLGKVIDDQGTSTGELTSGDITDDASPELSGTAEAGSLVTIYDNGTAIGSVYAGTDGSWSFTPSPPLSNGPHSLTVTSSDAAGNISAPTPAFELEIVAGGAPSAPAITSVIDDQGEIKGALDKGATTDDTTPTITGTGVDGDTILVYDGTTLLGTTTVVDGLWSFTPSTPLAEGTHNLIAQAQNPAGNLSPATGAYPITVDTTAPTVPTGQALIDDVGANTGPISSGSTTDDANPTFEGMAEAGSTVNIYNKGILIGSTTADASGAWSFTPATALVDGSYSLAAQAVDSAGNVGPMGPAIDFTVDTTAVVISITSVEDNAGSSTGNLTSGQTTDDTTPTLKGQATPGATVSIYDGANLLGTVIASGTGEWSYTTSALIEGPHSFTATATTPAGGESAPTPVFETIIDTTAPTAPAIGGVSDDVGSVQGPISSGSTTDDTTPTLSGSGLEPGDTVEILDGGLLIGTTKVNADGTWSYTPTTPLNDDSHSFTVVTRDPAGNASAPSEPWVVIIDTKGPVAVITSLTDDVGTGTPTLPETIANGGETDDRSPVINGTAEAGSIVTIYANGEVLGSTVANGSGVWTFEPSEPLELDTYKLTATATDKAGNTGPESALFEFDLVSVFHRPVIVDSFGPVNVVIGTTPLDLGAMTVANFGGGGISARGGDAIQMISGAWASSPGYNTQKMVFNLKGEVASQLALELDGFNIASSGTTPLPIGTHVGTLKFYDLDGVEIHTYQILSSNTSGDIKSFTMPDGKQFASFEVVQVAPPFNHAFSIGMDNIVASQTPFEVIGDFGPPVVFADDQSVALDDFTLTKESVSGSSVMSSGASIKLSNGVITPGKYGSQKAIFDLNGEPMRSVALDFTISVHNDGTALPSLGTILGLIQFYAEEGGEPIYTHTIKYGDQNNYLSLTMPNGMEFSSFQVTQYQAPNKINYIFDIDNIIFGNPDTIPETREGSDNINDDLSAADQLIEVAEGEELTVEAEGTDAIDTLTLTGADQVLDLTALAEGQVTSMEVIDITGTGDNVLNLSLSDVLAQGGNSLFTGDDSTQMMIKGNAGDVVNLADLLPDGTDPGDWASAGTATVAGVVYNVYQHSSQDAQLLVQDGVTTNLV